jgi:hypothetical protein
MRRFDALQSAALFAATLALGGWLIQTASCVGIQSADGKTSPAAGLVAAAASAGAAGNETERERLLDRAVKADPEYGPARWQKNQIKFSGEWRTPEEISQLVSTDARWKEYRELRQEVASIADHVRLAQWCLRNNLNVEERFHWSVVLLADPSNSQARQRLGVRQYHGGLFTNEQVAEHERQLKEAKANLQRYRPVFIELCREARSESASARAAALKKIQAVSDPGAIAALEEAIGRDADKPDPRTKDLYLALVMALSNIRDHEATLHLMSHAVFSTYEQVRTAAAKGLRSRPKTDYMPIMMAALSAPLELEFTFTSAPDGSVRMSETLVQSGPESTIEHVRSTNYLVGGYAGRDRTVTNENAVLEGHLASASARVSKTRDALEETNAQSAKRNERIQAALKVAAGMDYGSDPEPWWKAWQEENELEYATAPPTNRTYEENNYIYQYKQAPKYQLVYGGSPPAKSAPAQPYKYARPYVTAGRTPTIDEAWASRARYHACFAPGTPVWTEAGVRPIEQVGVGDLLLSQNPATGELSYRCVLEKTLGNPTEVLNLKFPSETITATTGHRFWVDGQGWQMAKQLTGSSFLQSLNQKIRLEAVSRNPERIACYNFIVDEFHTFFVGKERIVVHDKSCPLPVKSLTFGVSSSKLAGAPSY